MPRTSARRSHQLDTGNAEAPAESWCEVEAEIDEVLKRHDAK
jgi:hypothetical protein